jgi:hypothetical protein
MNTRRRLYVIFFIVGGCMVGRDPTSLIHYELKMGAELKNKELTKAERE